MSGATILFINKNVFVTKIYIPEPDALKIGESFLQIFIHFVYVHVICVCFWFFAHTTLVYFWLNTYTYIIEIGKIVEILKSYVVLYLAKHIVT